VSKGSYPGGGTVIGPADTTWFGFGGDKGGLQADANAVAKRVAHPLTADAERQISKLRVDRAGLERQLAQLEQQRLRLQAQLKGTETDLARLLHHHGLPLDKGLIPLDLPRSNKTTRHQRRKRARENDRNGK
jgi:multidrug efflux pump subunit AcrA (membrane-fusion protein)